MARVSTFGMTYLGLSMEQLSGDGWLESVAPSHRAWMRNEWRVRVREATPFQLRLPLRRAADGQHRWHLVRAAPVLDSGGYLSRWVGMALDVHDALAAPMRPQDEAERLRALGEASPVMLYLKDRDSRLVWCNPAVLKVFGKDASALLGQPPETVFSDAQDLQMVLANDREVMDTGRATVRQEELHPLGRIYLATKAPWRDAQGRIIGVVGVSVDITKQRETEAQLAERSARLEVAMAAAGLRTWSLDVHAREFLVPAETRAQHAIPGEDRVPWDLAFSGLHPEDRDRVVAAVERCAAGGPDYDATYRTCDAQGRWSWVRAAGRLVNGDRTANGRPQVFGITIDLSEHREAQARLLDSEERLSLAMEASALAWWAVDPVAGTVEWSPEVWSMYGLRPEPQVDLQRALQAIHPGDRDRIAQRLAQALGSRAADDFADSYRVVRPDGQERIFETRGRVRWAVGPDGREKPLRFAGVLRDVTEERALMQQLQQANDALRLMAERVDLALDAGAIVGTWTWDLSSDLITCDARFAHAFGLDPQRCLRGIPVQEATANVHPEDLPQLETAYRDAIQRGGRYSHQYRVRNAAGEMRWVEAAGRVDLDAEGRPVRFPGVLLDVQERHATQVELERTGALLKTVLEAVPGVVYAKDREGRMLMANQGTTALIGKPPSAYIGRTDLEFLADKQQAAVIMANDRRIMDTEQGEQLEEEVRRSDGTPAWWLSTKLPLRDAQGRVIGLIGASLDITARKAAETELVRSEARFRSFVEASAQVLWRVDAQARVIDEQPSWQSYTGQDTEAAFGMGWLEVIHPEDRPAVCQAWAQAIEQGHGYMVEYRLRRHDGVWRRVIARGAPVRDAAGVLLEWMGTCVDVTDERAAQAALQDSEQRLRTLLDTLPVGAVLVEAPSGRVMLHNAALMRIERGLAKAADQRDYGIWQLRDRHGGPLALHDYPLMRTLRTSEPVDVVVQLLCGDGVWRWMHVATAPVLDAEGRLGAVVGVCEDVDARERFNEELEHRVAERTRELQAAQQQLAHARRLDALGQLAGGIAHDFNNVLQSVVGAAAILSRRADDPATVQRLAHMVSEAASRGSSVTRRLLAFSRRGDLRVQPVAVAPMLGDLREMLVHTLGVGVGVRLQLPETLPHALADRGQLETVLVNLATNARDAMQGQGLITIAVAAEQVREPRAVRASQPLAPGDYLRIDVQDTGAGMSPQVLERVTEPFFTTKPQDRGTGLGLAMARGFAEQSGGALHIASAPGQGTTVSLWLPQAPQTVAASEDDAAEPPAPRGTRAPRILLVDDDPLVRGLLAEALREQRYEVAEADSGDSALARIGSCDLVVTDLSMPGMDGLELLRRLQMARPGLPGILLTGFISEAADQALAATVPGACVVLRKPVQAEQIAEHINVLLAAQGS